MNNMMFEGQTLDNSIVKSNYQSYNVDDIDIVDYGSSDLSSLFHRSIVVKNANTLSLEDVILTFSRLLSKKLKDDKEYVLRKLSKKLKLSLGDLSLLGRSKGSIVDFQQYYSNEVIFRVFVNAIIKGYLTIPNLIVSKSMLSYNMQSNRHTPIDIEDINKESMIELSSKTSTILTVDTWEDLTKDLMEDLSFNFDKGSNSNSDISILSNLEIINLIDNGIVSLEVVKQSLNQDRFETILVLYKLTRD